MQAAPIYFSRFTLFMRKFAISLFSIKEANVILLGLDYTKDSKEALRRIRESSYFVEPFDLFGKNLLEGIKLFDAGNLKIRDLEDISKKFMEIRKENKTPLMISRGHLPTFYATKNLKKERLIVFDAHADCKDEYLDELIIFDVDKNKDKKKFNGSTWLRRLLENFDIEVLLIGLRSFSEDEIIFLRNKRVKFFTSIEIVKNRTKVMKEVTKFTKDFNLYVSIDLDVFDPSILPATDYPEPGGLNYFDFIDIMKAFTGKLIGADVCCFKPTSSSFASEFLINKLIFHLLSKI